MNPLNHIDMHLRVEHNRENYFFFVFENPQANDVMSTLFLVIKLRVNSLRTLLIEVILRR